MTSGSDLFPGFDRFLRDNRAWLDEAVTIRPYWEDGLKICRCDECLNEALFTPLAQARAVLILGLDDHNRVRPYSNLGGARPSSASATRRTRLLTGEKTGKTGQPRQPLVFTESH
jgi:hypothetical protein